MLRTTALILATLSCQIGGEDNPDATRNDENGGWIGAHLNGAAADYAVSIKQDEKLIGLVLKKPLLRFSDPVTNVADGYLLVWTRQDRPAASASFWVHRLSKGLRELHEFQSLSERPIRARRDVTDVWHPEAAGIAWHSLKDAPAPAGIEARRLAQMRQLARQFSASIRDRTGRQQLRLLPQPVYRYASPAAQVLDGALFVFSKGTNPELLLLIEAREEANKSVWQYATGRMTIREIEVRHQDEIVDTKPSLGGRIPYNDPAQPYFEFRRNLQAPGTTP